MFCIYLKVFYSEISLFCTPLECPVRPAQPLNVFRGNLCVETCQNPLGQRLYTLKHVDWGRTRGVPQVHKSAGEAVDATSITEAIDDDLCRKLLTFFSKTPEFTSKLLSVHARRAHGMVRFCNMSRALGIAMILLFSAYWILFLYVYPRFALSELAEKELLSPRAFTDQVRTIYSFGEGRSGSTFQFVLLCVIAHLRSESVSCAGEPARLQVVKGHPANSVLQLGASSMLFTTTRRDDIWQQLNFTIEGGRVSYAQRYTEFIRCPLCEVDEYREIFNLTDIEILQLTQYMRYWSILRQCCGSQMSKWLRGKLFGCSGMDSYDIQGKLDYHMCDAINLTSVEESFEQASLYKIVPCSRLSPKGQLKFHWSKKGDCRMSHSAARNGTGFNLASIQSDFCERLVSDPTYI